MPRTKAGVYSRRPEPLVEGPSVSGSARVIVIRRTVTPDAGYGGVGVNVDFLVPNHRGHRGEAAMVAVGNERTSS